MNKKYKVGTTWKIADGSGLRSCAIVDIVAPIPWEQIEGMYKEPDLKKEVCCKIIAYGPVGEVLYMFKNRLIPYDYPQADDIPF